MKIEILGCSGGMGLGLHTTCLRINQHLLIDAGSGLGQLRQEELLAIRHILITHAHLDHLCFLPLLIDNLFEHLERPIEVYALPEVIQVMQEHIFNWKVWPDFSTLPTPEHPVVRFHPLTPAQPLVIEQLQITPFLVEHTVPTCGYHLVSEQGRSFAFTGDTTFTERLITRLNQLGPLDVLMTECAFPNRMQDLAHASRHLTPALLDQLLVELAHPPQQVWLSHLKPSQTAEISSEIQQLSSPSQLHLLRSGEQFSL